MFFIQPEVFGRCGQEVVLAADYLAVEGVDDRIRFAEEAVNAAYLLQILFPFGAMLDDNSEIDVIVFGFDSASDFFALDQEEGTYAVSILSAEPAIM